jgi:hypothetical protein
MKWVNAQCLVNVQCVVSHHMNDVTWIAESDWMRQDLVAEQPVVRMFTRSLFPLDWGCGLRDYHRACYVLLRILCLCKPPRLCGCGSYTVRGTHCFVLTNTYRIAGNIGGN